MSAELPRDIREVRRWLRDDAIRRGKARPRTIREWEIWRAGLRERLGPNAPPDEDESEAPGDA